MISPSRNPLRFFDSLGRHKLGTAAVRCPDAIYDLGRSLLIPG
jgi:hypothetical protein